MLGIEQILLGVRYTWNQVKPPAWNSVDPTWTLSRCQCKATLLRDFISTQKHFSETLFPHKNSSFPKKSPLYKNMKSDVNDEENYLYHMSHLIIFNNRKMILYFISVVLLVSVLVFFIFHKKIQFNRFE